CVAAGALSVAAAPVGEEGASVGEAGVTGACSAGPTPSPNERFSNSPGIENRNAIKKNTIAAVIVILAKTVWVPRGPNAAEFTPPPNTADASDLPGCKSTNIIKTKHDTTYSTVRIIPSTFKTPTCALLS